MQIPRRGLIVAVVQDGAGDSERVTVRWATRMAQPGVLSGSWPWLFRFVAASADRGVLGRVTRPQMLAAVDAVVEVVVGLSDLVARAHHARHHPAKRTVSVEGQPFPGGRR